MRIGVLYNCQGLGLANSLRVLLSNPEVIEYNRGTVVRDNRVDEVISILRDCDAVICTVPREHLSALSTDTLRAAGCRPIVVPHVTFSGFHPDTISLIDANGSLRGTTGDYHSRLIIIGFLAGLSIADTAGLFNGIVFRRLNYFDYYRTGEAFLTGCFEQYGIDIIPYLARWRKVGVFMHNINHPKISVICDLAEIACRVAGLETRVSADACDLVPDSLARFPKHPVFPEIAREFGGEGYKLYRLSSRPDETGFEVLTLPEFIAREFALYPGFDRAKLMAADGVRSGLEALGLH